MVTLSRNVLLLLETEFSVPSVSLHPGVVYTDMATRKPEGHLVNQEEEGVYT